MKKSIAVLLSFYLLTFLFGCSSYPEEYENKNINKKQLYEKTALSEINFYYGATDSFANQFGDPNFSKIIYSAYSALNDMTTIEADSVTNIHYVNDIFTENDLDKFIVQPDIFSKNLSDVSTYKTDGNNILKAVLNSLQPEGLSVVVTDLGVQLDDYSNLGKLIIDNALSKELTVAVIGINSRIKPYFIFAIGNADKISDYVSRFNEKPDVLEYAGVNSTFQTNETRNVNYEIFANNNGIMGIDYKNISFVENGLIRILQEDEVVHMKDTVEDPQTGEKILVETDGSFTEIKEDYTIDRLNVIEGTVNFGDISSEPMLVKLRVPRPTREEREQNPEQRLTAEDYTYLAAVSLVDDPSLNLSGKIKLKIPFSVIKGVKLSTLDCNIESAVYTTNGKIFKQITDSPDKYLTSTVAEGSTPSQGKWRVDDKTNSLIFNILVNNAAVLPRSKGFIKLDVTIRHFASRETQPSWVKDWSSVSIQQPSDETAETTEMVEEYNTNVSPKVPNLHNLFDTLYAYQSQQNGSENSFTIYIANSRDEKRKSE